MKIPIKLAKFIFKRELKIIIIECQRRSTTCSLTANLSNSVDTDYLRGKASAYNELIRYLENEITKLNGGTMKNE